MGADGDRADARRRGLRRTRPSYGPGLRRRRLLHGRRGARRGAADRPAASSASRRRIAYSPGGSQVFVGDQYSGVVQRFSRSGDVAGSTSASARTPARPAGSGRSAGSRPTAQATSSSSTAENDRVQVFDGRLGRVAGGVGQQRDGGRPASSSARTRARAASRSTSPAAERGAASSTSPTRTTTACRPSRSSEQRRATSWRRAAAGPALGRRGRRAGAGRRCGARSGDCSATRLHEPGVRPAASTTRRASRSTRSPTRPAAVTCWWPTTATTASSSTCPTAPTSARSGTFGDRPGPVPLPLRRRGRRTLAAPALRADNNNHRVQVFDVGSLGFVGEWGGFGPEPGALEFTRGRWRRSPTTRSAASRWPTTRTTASRPSAPTAPLQAVWGIAGRGPGYVRAPAAWPSTRRGRARRRHAHRTACERLAPDGAYLGQTGYIADRTGFAAPDTGPGQFDGPAVGWPTTRATRRCGSPTRATTASSTSPRTGRSVATYGRRPERAARRRGGESTRPATILVADTGNDRVRRLDPAGGAWSTVALGGTAVYAPARRRGDRGRDDLRRRHGARPHPRARPAAVPRRRCPPRPARPLARPTGLFGQGDSLWVADTGNSRILRLATGTGAWDGSAATAARAAASWRRPASRSPRTARRSSSPTAATTGSSASRCPARPAPVATPVDVALAGGGRGAVTSDLAGIACPPDCRQAFSPGATLTLTAAPAAGSAFAGWSGACTGTGPCRLAVGAAPAGATATFELVGPAAPGPLPPPVAAAARRFSARRFSAREVGADPAVPRGRSRRPGADERPPDAGGLPRRPLRRLAPAGGSAGREHAALRRVGGSHAHPDRRAAQGTASARHARRRRDPAAPATLVSAGCGSRGGCATGRCAQAATRSSCGRSTPRAIVRPPGGSRSGSRDDDVTGVDTSMT